MVIRPVEYVDTDPLAGATKVTHLAEKGKSRFVWGMLWRTYST